MTLKTVLCAALIAATPFVATSMAQAKDKVGFKNGGYENIAHRRNGRHPFARKFRNNRCVAVAKRVRGFGARIPSTRRVASAPRIQRACRIALNQCNRALDRSQHRGLNRWASCRVVNRIR